MAIYDTKQVIKNHIEHLKNEARSAKTQADTLEIKMLEEIRGLRLQAELLENLAVDFEHSLKNAEDYQP